MILPDRLFVSEWIRDERLRRLRPQVQLLLVFLRPLCDRYGRFEFNPALIHMALYESAKCGNVSARDVEIWLEMLRSGGFIKSYTGSDGRRVGEVAKEYWRQKLSHGKAAFEPEGNEPQLELGAPPETDPPPLVALGSDMKRSESSGARERAPGEALYFSERLFNTMAELCGYDLTRITRPCRTKINAALRAIREVHPNLLPPDLEQAAAAYRKLYATADLTPNALASHWPKLMGQKAAPVQPLVPIEPDYWRELLNEEYPNSKYSRGAEHEGTAWHDLPSHVRTLCLEKLPAWLAKTGRASRPAA